MGLQSTMYEDDGVIRLNVGRRGIAAHSRPIAPLSIQQVVLLLAMVVPLMVPEARSVLVLGTVLELLRTSS